MAGLRRNRYHRGPHLGRLVLTVVVLVVGIASLLRVGGAAMGATPPRQVQRQLNYLEAATASGAPERMQNLFPEGAFFTHVLTGLTEARAGDPQARLRAGPRERWRAAARGHLAYLDSPAALEVFGGGMQPEHGVFAAGWRLQLSARIAEAGGGEPADLADLTRRAEELSAVVGRQQPGDSPFLAGYPGQFWPCDTVVAMASLAEAGRVAGRADWREQATRWARASVPYRDPETGLLPHRVDAAGAALEGPRGSSQSIIQAFWPRIALRADPGQWSAFVDHFVVREVGLVGVREHPRGRRGEGDVDSGPLIRGVSLSASAVGLAAARANGDLRLAADLSGQADVFGAPVGVTRVRYAGGLLPVGDAFLAWARTSPYVDSDADVPTPRPWWLLWLVPGGLLVVAAGVIRPRLRPGPASTGPRGRPSPG